MLILITSGTIAPVLINSFFLLNLLFFSDVVDFSDVDLACDGRGVEALGVLLAVDLLFSVLQASSLLFSFRKYNMDIVIYYQIQLCFFQALRTLSDSYHFLYNL